MRPLPFRLALGGPMGSGKSSVAHALTAQGYARLAFADQLRAMLKVAYGEIDKGATYQLDGGPLTGRELLQVAGSSLRRIDRQIFIKALARELDKLRVLGCPVVVDDVRMESEAEFLKANGFYLVRLDAHPEIRRKRARASDEEFEHQTESVSFEAPVIDTTALPVAGVVRLIEEHWKEYGWQE